MVCVLALALIAFACAIGFRWPVMVCIGFLVFVLYVLVRFDQGSDAGSALTSGLISFVAIQLFYIFNGSILTLSVGKIGPKGKLNV